MKVLEVEQIGLRKAQEVRARLETERLKFSLAQLRTEHKALKLPLDEEWLNFARLPSEFA